MKFEIERKARVADPEGLRRALEARCGPPRVSVKNDRYYIEPGVEPDPERVPAPRIARLRREGPLGIVTAKCRTLVAESEVNREFEFAIDDADDFEEFIRDYLGFRVLVDKIKHTWKYKDHPLVLELSQVETLGWFFEVEYLADAESERDGALALLDETFARFQPHLGAVEPRQYILLLLQRADAPVR